MEIIVPNESKSLNRRRHAMPQITSDNTAKFVQYMQDAGIGHTKGVVNPRLLKPTQKEFNFDKVKHMMEDLRKNPILVSSDLFILDGHHTWLANANSNTMQPVIKFSAKIDEVLDAAHEFGDVKYRKLSEQRRWNEFFLTEASPLGVSQMDIIRNRYPGDIYVPLSEKELDKLFDLPREVAFHTTSLEGLKTLWTLQHSKKSISSSLEPSEMMFGGGPKTGGGILVVVEGKVLISSKIDLGSVYDTSGTRWVSAKNMFGSIPPELKAVTDKLVADNVKLSVWMNTVHTLIEKNLDRVKIRMFGFLAKKLTRKFKYGEWDEVILSDFTILGAVLLDANLIDSEDQLTPQVPASVIRTVQMLLKNAKVHQIGFDGKLVVQFSDVPDTAALIHVNERLIKLGLTSLTVFPIDKTGKTFYTMYGVDTPVTLTDKFKNLPFSSKMQHMSIKTVGIPTSSERSEILKFFEKVSANA